MENKKYDNQKRQEMAREYLEPLVKDTLSDDMADRIRVWFAGEEDRDLKDSALEMLFNETVEEETPDQTAYEMLAEVKREIYVSENTYEKYKVRKLSVLRRTMRFAAVLLPALLIVGVIYQMVGTKTIEHHQQYALSFENERYLKLPDGSEVWPSEGTIISYDENFLQNRIVKIDGEAYFSVVKQKDSAPFDVISKSIKVRVLGTEFSVVDRGGIGEVSVVLASGSVEVKAVNAKGDAMKLKPMERVRLNKDSEKLTIESVSPAEIKKIQSDNLICFDSTPIEEVFRRIGVYYDIPIEMNGEFEQRIIRVEFLRGDPLDGVLSVIRATAENSFDYTIEGDRVVIRGRK